MGGGQGQSDTAEQVCVAEEPGWAAVGAVQSYALHIRVLHCRYMGRRQARLRSWQVVDAQNAQRMRFCWGNHHQGSGMMR